MIFWGRKLTISIGTAWIWPAKILRGERATGHKRISLKLIQIYKYFCECLGCCSLQCDPWGRSRPPCIELPCKSRLGHTGAGLNIYHHINSCQNRNIILFARKRPSRCPRMVIQTCFNIVCARVNTAAWSSLALSTWAMCYHFHSSIYRKWGFIKDWWPVKLAVRESVARLPSKTWGRPTKVGTPAKARVGHWSSKARRALTTRSKRESSSTSTTTSTIQRSSPGVKWAALSKGVSSLSRGAGAQHLSKPLVLRMYYCTRWWFTRHCL